jgi:hypothetical protein
MLLLRMADELVAVYHPENDPSRRCRPLAVSPPPGEAPGRNGLQFPLQFFLPFPIILLVRRVFAQMAGFGGGGRE